MSLHDHAPVVELLLVWAEGGPKALLLLQFVVQPHNRKALHRLYEDDIKERRAEERVGFAVGSTIHSLSVKRS